MYANPDGTFTLEQSAVPERVSRDGDWVDVDTTLVRRADGGFEPTAVPADVRFSAGGADPLARIAGGGADAAKAVELTWLEELPAPVVFGDTATYPEVYPGVDLRVRATPNGIAHEIVVKTREAAENPALERITFDLRAEGVRVVSDDAGNLQAVDDAGRAVFTASAPKMWDSPVSQEKVMATGEGPRNEAPVDVELADGRVTLVPDQEMLAAVNTTYPVVIDPDFSYVTPEQAAWTLVRRSEPNTSHWNLAPRDQDERDFGVARVGHAPGWPSEYMDRSLFRFDTTAVRGAQIVNAQFQIFQVWKNSHTCDPALVPPVDMWLTGPIGPGTTWNAQPAWIRWINGVRSVPKAGQPCGPDWVGIDAWSAVQEAADKQWIDVTLGLKATDGDEASNSPDGWKRFHVKEQDGIRLYPKLFITYNRAPFAPHEVFVEPWRAPCRWCDGMTYLGGDEAHLKARLSDPNGGQLRAMWDIYTPGHQPREQWLASGSMFSTPLDLRPLHGSTVSWRVRGNDGWLDGPTANGPSFVVDRVAPEAAPTVVSSLYPADDAWHGGEGVPGQFAFSASGVSDVDHYVYGFQDPPTTLVDADTLGGSAVVTLKPPRDGPVDLYVQSVDRAGNRSPMTVHHFYVRAGNGALAHWPLDGDATDAAYLGDRHGMPQGGVTWTPGAVGSAGQFDGADDHVTARNAVATDSSFSVSAWVRPDVIGEVPRTAVSQDASAVSGFMLQMRPDGRWHFVLAGADEPDGGTFKAFATSQTVTQPGQWTHLTGVYDEATGEVRLYVDGALAGSAKYWGDIRATGDVAIGRAKWNGVLTDYWTGALDEVRVYDRVLAASEIQSLVSLDNVRTGHWKFDNPEDGTTVANTVPGGQPMTLHGGTYTDQGAIGHAVEFDGVDDYATTAEPVVRSDGATSVAAWVRLSEKPTEVAAVASQNGTLNAAFALGYLGSAQDRWGWVMRGPDGQDPLEVILVSSSSVPQVGVWTHLVGVYDVRIGEMRLYVNGELEAREKFTSPWHTTDGQFALGRARSNDGAWDYYWPGAIDEVRTYSRALSDQEIRGIVSQDNVTAGEWKLDGNAIDSSGNGLDGIVHGGPIWTNGQSDFPNAGDQAVQLDGTDDHISTPQALDTDRSFSVGAWVRLDRTGDWYEAVSQDGTRTSGFHLQATPEGKWGFSMFGQDIDGGGMNSRVASAETAQIGVWTHLVAVYDHTAGTIRLYVNGRLAAEKAHTSNWNATGGLQIGRGQWSGEQVDHWPGAIDDVQAYSRVLYEEDVRLLAGRDLTLVHNWRLDETAGTTAADAVGGTPGTVIGGATFGPGRVGNAVALDGVDDHVSTSTVNLRTSESFTISAWVYLSRKDDGQVTAVSVDGTQNSKFRLGHVVDMYDNPFGSWIFELPESDTASAPVTKAALSVLETELDTWTHLVGVYDAAAGKVWLYVNGERVGDGSLKNPWQSTGGTQIGRGKQGGAPAEFWSGKVDDVRVYTGRLSTDRIKTLYASYGPG
ncbi:LamG-like jellyroll fold domain-containing protein [Saccharopolyspora shandongensis]|uniref:LamG-like jellyroll fold domain-containing protein n=1 Tax=Saccharopolyspora shandongensis TaxID=418495 RepID=UPI0033F8D491